MSFRDDYAKMTPLCGCGCGKYVPKGKRDDARHINGSHRAAASRRRKGVEPWPTPKAHKRRTSPPTVHVRLSPEDGRTLATMMEWLDSPPFIPDPSVVKAVKEGLERYEKRKARAT